jgi:hypothetical protein
MKLPDEPYLPTDPNALVRQLTDLWRTLVDWSRGVISNSDTTGVADTNVMAYNAATDMWKPVAAAVGGSGITRSVGSIAAPVTAGAAAATDYMYFVSGTTTLTLPTAVGNTNRYTVKNTGVATVSIATTAAQTIDGSASPITLPVANTSLDLVSDGANWRIE